jgi:ribose transport system permease protein
VNPYLYPLIISGVIFVAVLLDAIRSQVLAQVNRRRIFVEASTG